MSNMSYCRFYNTYYDLVDCYDHFSDDLGEDEEWARKRILLLCYDIVHEYADELDPTINED